jgi:hypothetical protein
MTRDFLKSAERDGARDARRFRGVGGNAEWAFCCGAAYWNDSCDNTP